MLGSDAIFESKVVVALPDHVEVSCEFALPPPLVVGQVAPLTP